MKKRLISLLVALGNHSVGGGERLQLETFAI